MIINARIVKNPRTQRVCESCRKYITGEQLRLFGMAERGDRPYAMYLHPECSTGKETKEALGRSK